MKYLSLGYFVKFLKNQDLDKNLTFLNPPGCELATISMLMDQNLWLYFLDTLDILNEPQSLSLLSHKNSFTFTSPLSSSTVSNFRFFEKSLRFKFGRKKERKKKTEVLSFEKKFQSVVISFSSRLNQLSSRRHSCSFAASDQLKVRHLNWHL